MTDVDLTALLKALDIEFKEEGDLSQRVSGFSAIAEAREKDLSFCSSTGARAIEEITNSEAGIILCNMDLFGSVHPKKQQRLIFTSQPRLAIMRAIKSMEGTPKPLGKSPFAFISPTSIVGKNCYVGHYTVIGDRCIIGDDTFIYDRVSLVQNCEIGKRCIIQSGATLGPDGFAFDRLEDLTLERFPHVKGVRIGDDVEIGPNCTVARGSLSDTTINDGTKVDALVHIAHNVQIGKNCQITAGTIFGGSSTLGDNCWTGLNSTIKHKIKIGNSVIIGAGACVIHDVPDGDIVAGVPAKSIKDKVTTDKVFLMAGQKPR